jgi:hypothetical protein
MVHFKGLPFELNEMIHKHKVKSFQKAKEYMKNRFLPLSHPIYGPRSEGSKVESLVVGTYPHQKEIWQIGGRKFR